MSCRDADWSIPKPVAERSSRIARLATIGANGPVTYIVGNNISDLDRMAPSGDLLTTWTLDGKTIGSPPGDFAFLHPKSAVDTTGRLHVMWAEPHPPAARGTPVGIGTPLRSVWVATYKSPEGWSRPKKLHEGSIFWSKALNDLIAQDNGSLGIIAAWISSFVFFHFDGQTWSARVAASTTPGIGNSVALHDGKAYHAYMGVVPLDNAANNVFLARSDDAGGTWQPPKLVGRSASSGVGDLKIRVAKDGTLYILWTQPLRERRPVLRLVLSRDGGETWSPPSDLSVPEGYNAPQVAVDRCGRVHVVLEHFPGMESEGHLDHSIWDGQWFASRHLFTDFRAHDAALKALDDGRLLLVMLSQSAGSPLSSPYTSLMSELAP